MPTLLLPRSWRLIASSFFVLASATPIATANPVISEIMYHAPHGVNPENSLEEWIELHNTSGAAIDLTGWKLTKGVGFTIPGGTTIPAGGHVVVAADLATFQTNYPGFAGMVVGGWTGRLSNTGENVELSDPTGSSVSKVAYADEGDWATRVRGELTFSHRGWNWESLADGGGRSLELRNPALGVKNGQNWGVSVGNGGTPGAANSVASLDVAPLIKNVKHRPELPRSTDPITVSTNIEDEAPGATATLRWRLDGGGAFASLAMSDTDGDGDVEATIPAQADQSVLEWYIEATDGTNARTWPAAARTSNPGVMPETFGQATNALVQVDDGFDPNATFTTPANSPIYRLIMTNAERLELAAIGSTSGEEDSEATMNGTFITHDGTGIQTVYNAGFRNRGLGSALGPPNNFHVSLRSDDKWNGRASMALNCQWGYSQVLGNTLFDLAGIPPQEAAIVRVRVNGTDLSESGNRMYGRYARVESRGGDWAERHFPNDPDGNFYRLDDHAYPQGDPRSGEFSYEGSDPASYSDTFFKETNKDDNDFSDLINLARIVSAPATGGNAGQPAIADSAYPAAVEAVLDLDQFYRFIATDALIGNQEGGLQSGRADDASLYRGVVDTRFRFVPHDLDDVFNIGNGAGNPVTRSIFSYDISSGGLTGLTRLFNHPQLLPRYYSAVLAGLDTWFTSATVDPVIDRIMAGWVPAGTVTTIKGFVGQRRANVLGQIPQSYSANVTTSGPDIGSLKRTTNGAANFNGNFNVARTYSITVNGQLAQTFYRTAGADAAGSWRLAVPAGGGNILGPGYNNVVVRFWSAPGGTGDILQENVLPVLNQPASATYTNVSGTLAPAGTLAVLAPESYIPGVPFLVRVDLKNGEGAIDRAAWNRTATLTASGGITLTPNTVSLTNGMGSALVTVGGGATTTQSIFTYGTGGNGTAGSGTPGSQWKAKSDFNVSSLATFITNSGSTWFTEGFDDSGWTTVSTQAGYGDDDENTPIPDIDYDPGTGGSQNVPCYLFRNTFTIADITAVTSVTGQVKYDDAYRLYVNGVKISNSAGLGDAITLNQYATGTAGDNATANFTVPLGMLHSGVNTIAVQVHQDDANSSDVTFDLRLQADVSTGAADPGNFSLTAAVGALNTSKSITSLTPTPAMTNVAGTLPAGTTNWSGVINVTGDVTVPATGTLNIAPGTHILVAGDATADSSAGSDIIVTTGGTVNAAGTAAQPISITASNASTRWGEINVNGSTTNWHYCLVSRACHSPGGGHTGKGPAFRLSNGANWTFEDGAITDLSGKVLTNSGNTTMTMRRSVFGRSVMGPETDGSAITIEDSNFTDMLPIYREAGAQDDEDCIYIHDSGGRPVNLRRSVFSKSGDDGIDLLAGAITVEDCIIRDIEDKGMSLLQNNVTVRRTQIIDCDFGISTKTQTGDESTPYTLTMENCTIVSQVHLTNQGDQSGGVYWHSVGVHVRNKYGTAANPQLFVVAHNCVISAVTPMLNDYPIAGNDFPLLTTSYTCYENVAGTNPVDPPVPTGGTGDLATDPLFVDRANRDFHLQASSPARDAGDPASPLDADGSAADMGALPFGGSGSGGGSGSITWTPANGPYRVTANTTVPANLSLVIQPGTSVYFDQNVRMTVNGNLQVLGTPERRVTFSSVPGEVAPGDSDPLKLGNQTGAPKWGGIRIYDSMAAENIVKNADFINAQGTSPSGSENYGSIGFIRSWGHLEGCTWAGTHLRMCYGRNSKLTVIGNTFPDMFIFDPVLGRIEEPTTDFIAAADNNMEPLKVEFPTTDAEVSGGNAANFPNGLPLNGHWRVYYNTFHGNRGHQDVFDCDSGRWAPRDVSGNQTNGQFVIDCRYNHFYGLAGDEHMDLGGDAYIASNVFENAMKDFWTNDTGYSNAISSGDKGTGTTILLARNVCYDLDHVINLKASTATIFEHNTIANLHPDFQFVGSTVTQNVICAPINFFVPGDGGAPSNGDGAYLGFNIISNVPHVFSSPDRAASGPITTKIEFFHNLLDQIADPVVGPNHPGGFFSGTYGPNTAGAPDFVDPLAENYGLRAGSPAQGTAPGGIDYGATIDEWAYALGGPSNTVSAESATFTIGGPGIVAYQWRLDGGAWSPSIQIGDGGLMPRGAPATTRQADLTLTGLAAGAHSLEIRGQDMAGNWQDDDPARTLIGSAQSGLTVRTWTVDPTASPVRLNEILAHSATLPDTIELRNTSDAPVDISGWSLSDDPLVPAKLVLPGGSIISANGFLSVTGLGLDRDGDLVQLRNGANLVDSVSFGAQVTDLTIGRIGTAQAWTLCQPTLGAANSAQRLGDTSGLRINEWLASGSVLYKSDWVELANTGALPVALDGLRLTDNRIGDPFAHTFAPLSFIGANGYARFLADGNPSSGPSHLPFSFDAQQETITLLSAEGAQLDYVFFYPQSTDYSQGRDATGALVFYELPTQGLENMTYGGGSASYDNAVDLIRYLRITEIMFEPSGGSDYEFVEFRNTGPVALDLTGVRITDGIDFVFPAMMLAPGAEVVIVSNLAAFQSRYGMGVNVAGVYTGKLNNAGETLALALPSPYDANILCFAYDPSWSAAAAGGGHSLTLVSGSIAANDFDKARSWQASAAIGGSPAGGSSQVPSDFVAWQGFFGVGQLTDEDGDSLNSLMEFSLGLDPNRASGVNGVDSLPAISIAPDGKARIEFNLPVNPAATDGFGANEIEYVVEVSTDIDGWQPIATKTGTTSFTGTGTVLTDPPNNGTVHVTVTDVGTQSGLMRHFIRVHVTWAP